jgi:bifunctional non-homologous end joining protein LigD
MLATLGKPPTRFTDFAVEAKYDGQRGLAVVDRGTVTLFSRNGADITRTFPEITAALPGVIGNRNVVLDGEIVAPDRTGVPSFSRLQRRWPQNRRPTAELLRQVPTRFYGFDVVEIDGMNITRRPYAERRKALDQLAAESRCRTVQFPQNWTDTDPTIVLEAAAELNLEGIVCKHLDSPYKPGVRSPYWIKTPLRRRSEFVIGGWLPGFGPNRHTIGGLLLGAHCPDGLLQFCGVVGTGFTVGHRRNLTEHLHLLSCNASPFATAVPDDVARHVRWVKPVLIGDVEYREFCGSLRHPSWKGLRPDITELRHIVVPAS